MKLLQKIFGTQSRVDFNELLGRKALIIDVRTPEEYNSGHIKGSINVPLQQFSKHIPGIRKLNRPVITCCLSGNRSEAAKKMLAGAGVESYNGGSWKLLKSIIPKDGAVV